MSPRETLAFLDRLKRLQVITDAGPVPLQWGKGARNCAIDLRALTATGAQAGLGIPPAPASGYVLFSDPTAESGARWVNLGTTWTNWTANVQANGGTFTANSLPVAARFIRQIKDATYLSKIKYLLPLLGSNLAAALTPMIDTLGVGAPGNTGFAAGDFTESTGLQCGSGKFLDSGILPSQLGTTSNGGLGWWENNFSGDGPLMGMLVNPGDGTRAYYLYQSSTLLQFGWNQDLAGRFAEASITGGNGHFYGQRSSAASRVLYKDGTVQGSSSTSDPADGASAGNIKIGGATFVGPGTTNTTPGRCACAYMTDGTMTADEIAAFHAALRDYLITPLGR